MSEDLDAWLMPYADHPDPELHDRYETLTSYDDGTFGKAFADFYEMNGFALCRRRCLGQRGVHHSARLRARAERLRHVVAG